MAAVGVGLLAGTWPDLILIDMQLPDFDGFEVLCYEEVLAPDAVARLAARSRS